MKICWTEQNHEIEMKFGQPLRGLQYDGRRPDKIVISFRELPGKFHYTQHLIDYIGRWIIPALEPDSKREIAIEW